MAGLVAWIGQPRSPTYLPASAYLMFCPALASSIFQGAECVYAIRSLATACEKLRHYLWPAGSVMPSSDRMLHWPDVASRVRCNQISGGSVLCRHKPGLDRWSHMNDQSAHICMPDSSSLIQSHARHQSKRFARATVDEKVQVLLVQESGMITRWSRTTSIPVPD